MVQFFQIFPSFVFLVLYIVPNTGNSQPPLDLGQRVMYLSSDEALKQLRHYPGTGGNYSEADKWNSRDDLRSAVTDPSPQISLPHIDPYHSTNITALAGTNTRLNCRVYRLGNKTVSWMRKDRLHLLTVGRYTYTSDLRYEASHAQHSADWGLVLRSAQSEDSGQYQCQVSTSPIITHDIWLSVQEASTSILGAPSMYVSVGSTINITCVIRNAAEFPASISWFHNTTFLSYSGPRPGVSMITDKSPSSVLVTLIISAAETQDSGTYFCRPSDSLPDANITVNVLEQTDYTAMLSKASTQGVGSVVTGVIILMCFILVQFESRVY